MNHFCAYLAKRMYDCLCRRLREGCWNSHSVPDNHVVYDAVVEHDADCTPDNTSQPSFPVSVGPQTSLPAANNPFF